MVTGLPIAELHIGEAVISFLFFFQAEDGIRDLIVTGVQTCALPIWVRDLAFLRAGCTGASINAKTPNPAPTKHKKDPIRARTLKKANLEPDFFFMAE